MHDTAGDHTSDIMLTGEAAPLDALTDRQLPFNVPKGTTSIAVKLSYTGRTEGNAIDLGILSVGKEFRGYSGGARMEAFVANDQATPGYIPGLIAPGEWYVHLGLYRIVEHCRYRVDITVDDRPRPSYSPQPAPSRAAYSGSSKLPPGHRPRKRWFSGDFHVHSIYSDGKMSMDEIVKKSQRRGLDFIFSTEHNTYSANQSWGYHVPEGFLVGRGIEVTTRAGHWNAIGLLPNQYIDPRLHDDKEASLAAAIREVHKSDGLTILNHPFGDCVCCDWSFSYRDDLDAFEVWNGPWKRHPEDTTNIRALAKWDSLLREGRYFVATGGSDIHESVFEIGEPCSKVLADELSVSAILRGIRQGNVYVVQHPSFEIDFQLEHEGQTAGVGDSLFDTKQAKASVSVSGFPDLEIRLLNQGGLLHTSKAAKFKEHVVGDWVRLEIWSMNGDLLGLTNPIWLHL